WVQYGHTLKEAGQLLDAERAFCRALLIDATLADCHLHLGHVFRAQRKTQAACASYLRAFALNPSASHPSLGELSEIGWTASQLTELLTLSSGSCAVMPTERATTTEPATAATEYCTAKQVIESPIDVDFDRDWYLWRYPDIAAAGVDPLTHYTN